MEFPQPITRGCPKFLKDRLNLLLELIRANRPIQGLNTTISETKNGIAINADQNSGSGGASQTDFSISDNGDGKLKIENGTINGVLPDGMTSGGDPAYTITVSESDKFAYLVVTARSTTGILSRAIDVGATVPADNPANSPGATGTYYLSLGDVSYDSGTGIISIGSGKEGIGSQTFNLCLDWYATTYSARWARS